MAAEFQNIQEYGWLAQEWSSSLASALTSMAGERPQTTCELTGPETGVDEQLWWQQSVNRTIGPAVWIGFSEAASKEIGARILRAAGIGDPESSDCAATCKEILSISLSGLAAAVTGRHGKEVVCTSGEMGTAPPEGLALFSVSAQYSDSGPLLFRAAFSTELAGLISAQQPAPAAAAPSIPASKAPAALPALLEMKVTLAVSMGRTQIPLQQILKLTTGSTIELDQIIDDPVQVLLNDNVVALGKVVVLDGNYAIEIQKISSRAERIHNSAAHRVEIRA